MSTVEQIINAIEQLSPADREKLERRMRWEDDEWDQQIAADFDSGKLNKLIEEAKADFKAGRTQDLP